MVTGQCEDCQEAVFVVTVELEQKDETLQPYSV